MNEALEKGASFIWNNARLLERAIFDYHFRNSQSDRIIDILCTYQNDDGGFGHALEPDLRAPDSHPLFVEFALRTLYECELRDTQIASRICDFLSRHADLEQGIATLLPTSQLYPRAPHWNSPGSLCPDMDRLAGLVGLVNWQGVDHPWLPAAVEASLQHIAERKYDEAHTILTAFCLVESVSGERQVAHLVDKLSAELFQANFFNLDVPVKQYGLTPLTFAPTPGSFCQQIFTQAQIEAHLDDLEANQQEDGGWPILWQPPGEIARWEWRGQRTVSALHTLRAYGRI
ncbi:MAG: hypothetical protein A2030_10270 [Chloroflexi bacterium RBG_19FT_COMBO_50_10]|nr:MAG: hypothetical protein A2030_10270 [Chloroflexi bacterium RBG_19FT_COMBO_50_10]